VQVNAVIGVDVLDVQEIFPALAVVVVAWVHAATAAEVKAATAVMD